MKINSGVIAVCITVIGASAMFAVAIYLSNQNIKVPDQYERNKRSDKEINQAIQSLVSPLNKVISEWFKSLQRSETQNP